MPVLAREWLCAAVGLQLAAASHVSIVNGSLVTDPIKHFSFFALPTQSAGSDAWLGCGASVISPTFALSSAHCFGGGSTPCRGPKNIALWIGDLELSQAGKVSGKAGSKSFRVEAELICHSSFDGKCSHGHDVALLKLKHAVPSWVKPVRLNLQGTAKDKPSNLATIIGFGLRETPGDIQLITESSPQHMRQAHVSVLAQNSAQCARVYAGGWGCSDTASEGSALNTHQQLCAGSELTATTTHDTCAGDSGSPVMDADNVQVAIVSYGGGPGNKRRGPGRTCGDPNYPGIYARVSAFASYLKSKVPDLPSSSTSLAKDDEGQSALVRRAQVRAHSQ